MGGYLGRCLVLGLLALRFLASAGFGKLAALHFFARNIRRE